MKKSIYEFLMSIFCKLALTSFCSVFKHCFQAEAVCSISAHRRHYAMFRAAPHRL